MEDLNSLLFVSGHLAVNGLVFEEVLIEEERVDFSVGQLFVFFLDAAVLAHTISV